jgi:GAF domain-containing protein
VEPLAGQRSDLTRRFLAAWSNVTHESEDAAPELLPTLLARAACTTLSADGAGLSIISNTHRVPVGASDDGAVAAERLQFTVGEGPCLDALANRRAVRVDEDQIRGDWPPFYAELIRETPYRSIIAVPLTFTDTLAGALDLYFTSPVMASYSAVSDAAALARHLTSMLIYAGTPPTESDQWGTGQMPDWMYGTQAQGRLRVWIAVGILMTRLKVSAIDALAVLRAHAFARNESIDVTSDALIHSRLDPQDLV